MKTNVTFWEPAGIGESATITAPEGATTITLRVSAPGAGSVTTTIKVALCRNGGIEDRERPETLQASANNVIRIFPNPVGDELTVTGTTATDKVVLTDIQGRHLIIQNGGPNLLLDMDKFVAGLYLLSIHSTTNSEHFKITKQ